MTTKARRKPGRPKGTRFTTSLGFRVNADLAADMERIAAAEECAVADLARRFLRQGVSKAKFAAGALGAL